MAVKRYLVVGLGQFGECIARSLAAANQEVMVIDRSMERVEAIKDVVAQAARADCTSEDAMRAMDAHRVDMAVMALGEEDFEAAVLGTSVLKSLGVGTIVARASTPSRGKILSLAGASRVVYPEHEMGEQIARVLLHSRVRAATDLPSGYTLAEVRLPELAEGKTLQELELRKTHALNVVAVNRKSGWKEASPEFRFESGDVVLVAGRSERVVALARLWEPEA